uniref:Uncharacterized protein n=1 Tax=Panagrolaimus sp. JU765 TaxID=591449 RepID=A0AC34QAI1_9BILA
MNAVVFLLNCLLLVLIVRVFADLKAVGLDVQLKNGDSGKIYFKGTRIELKICDSFNARTQSDFAYFCYRGTGGSDFAAKKCGSGYCLINALATVQEGRHKVIVDNGEDEVKSKSLLRHCPIRMYMGCEKWIIGSEGTTRKFITVHLFILFC